jgi:hypothetical protein
MGYILGTGSIAFMLLVMGIMALVNRRCKFCKAGMPRIQLASGKWVHGYGDDAVDCKVQP